MEVLSNGGVGRDRVETWRVYQKLPSLQHYVSVERDEPVIEVFNRALSALDLTIPLADIHRDVLSA